MVQNFIAWPEPYGNLAREMVKTVHTEMSSPGYLLRCRYYEENPLLLLGGEEVEYTEAYLEAMLFYSNVMQTTFIFYDKGHEKSKAFKEIFRETNPYFRMSLQVLYSIVSNHYPIIHVNQLALQMQVLITFGSLFDLSL